MNRDVLFSSANQNWKTPKEIYDSLFLEFNFDCDPSLVTENTIHPKDMLGSSWGKSNFCNPPYRQVAKWIQKGYYESQKGKTVVFLVAARTDTKWFHEYVLPFAKDIRFIKGRLKFNGAENSAPFPSMIVIFDKEVPKK